jgi:hypothetical protein
MPPHQGHPLWFDHPNQIWYSFPLRSVQYIMLSTSELAKMWYCVCIYVCVCARACVLACTHMLVWAHRYMYFSNFLFVLWRVFVSMQANLWISVYFYMFFSQRYMKLCITWKSCLLSVIIIVFEITSQFWWWLVLCVVRTEICVPGSSTFSMLRAW